MRKLQLLKTALLTLVLLLPALSSAAEPEEMMEPARQESMEPAQQETIKPAQESMESAQMTVERFVTSRNVENHEPVGVTDTFSADAEKAYAFLEATDISADVQVDFVWYHDETEIARVPLSIRKGYRWRTYSSKKLAGRTGKWRVEIQDQSGKSLSSLEFTVE